MTSRIVCSDAMEAMRMMPEASIDACVTDPPYGLEFMGKDWDGSDGFRRSLNASDVGRDNVFGGSSARGPEYRTAGVGKRSAPGIGDRETEWVSNQGWNQFRCETCGHLFHGGSPCRCEFPKPVRADNRWNLFQTWCEAWAKECLRVLKPGGHLLAFGGTRTYHRLACGLEDAGFEIRDQIGWAYGSGFPKSKNLDGDWLGWGTALKPAWEPIAVARKPLIGTVASNVAEYGTGALNIDGCRVPGTPEPTRFNPLRHSHVGYRMSATGAEVADRASPLGRWPANLIHDGSEVVLQAFPDSAGQQGDVRGNEPSSVTDEIYGKFNGRLPATARNDSGSAARFFYCAKASRKDRGEGNNHPTVKPTKLMRYLMRLVTPPGGVVLDPFMGSGTTGVAAIIEGFCFIGVEREAEYVEIARRRIEAERDLFSTATTEIES